MLRILLICTGNTCRSPMAEVFLQEKVKKGGLADRIKVLSAGLYAGGESPASPGARAAAARRGLDLAGHRSRQLLPEYVQAADLVLTMTQSHKSAVKALAPEAAGKVYSLGEYAGAPGDVPDPFGSGYEEYEACAVVIEELLNKAWDKIVALAGESDPM
ncbi:MAG: low molecular weight protein arginine phosphatase [Negativicutes bacterium]|nr:low molecular weight protein arginine phosphatase [Negativicutes bacterium]